MKTIQYLSLLVCFASIIQPIMLHAQNNNLVPITRLDGEGAGGYFLDLIPASANAILINNVQNEITYKPGAGPFEVKVIDPSALQQGTYTVKLVDSDLTDNILDNIFFWTLEGNGFSTMSQIGITNTPYEQQIPSLGISIKFQQTPDVFEDPYMTNGFIGATMEYADPTGVEWYGAMSDDEPGTYWMTNFVKTGLGDVDEDDDPLQIYNDVLDGLWYPFFMTTSTPNPNVSTITGDDYYLTPFPTGSAATFIGTLQNQNNQTRAKRVGNVDVVLTSDKTKWSRCVVLNTFSAYYENELGFNPDAVAGQYGIRSAASVDQNGEPDGTGTGMSWFPGYAIDVETGRRLNVFFGENTFFNGDSTNIPDVTGADMIWNPSTYEAVENPLSLFLTGLSFGAQHYTYVSNTTYDECAAIKTALENPIPFIKAGPWADLSWVTAPVPTVPLNSIQDGLIPNDLTFKLRVNNPFQTTNPISMNSGYGEYEFTIDTAMYVAVEEINVETPALEQVRVSPNPCYSLGNSQQVNIANLPPKSQISIYNLNGHLIRNMSSHTKTETWDMKDEEGRIVPKGIYIIYIDATEIGLGTKAIKWMGGN